MLPNQLLRFFAAGAGAGAGRRGGFAGAGAAAGAGGGAAPADLVMIDAAVLWPVTTSAAAGVAGVAGAGAPTRLKETARGCGPWASSALIHLI